MPNDIRSSPTVREQDLCSCFELLAETFEDKLKERIAELKREAHARVDLAWKAAEDRLFRAAPAAPAEFPERNEKAAPNNGHYDGYDEQTRQTLADAVDASNRLAKQMAPGSAESRDFYRAKDYLLCAAIIGCSPHGLRVALEEQGGGRVLVTIIAQTVRDAHLPLERLTDEAALKVAALLGIRPDATAEQVRKCFERSPCGEPLLNQLRARPPQPEHPTAKEASGSPPKSSGRSLVQASPPIVAGAASRPPGSRPAFGANGTAAGRTEQVVKPGARGPLTPRPPLQVRPELVPQGSLRTSPTNGADRPQRRLVTGPPAPQSGAGPTPPSPTQKDPAPLTPGPPQAVSRTEGTIECEG